MYYYLSVAGLSPSMRQAAGTACSLSLSHAAGCGDGERGKKSHDDGRQVDFLSAEKSKSSSTATAAAERNPSEIK
jgi:hypothetical protein